MQRLSLIIILVALAACTFTLAVASADEEVKTQRGDSDSPEVSDQLIESLEPRQYFKLSSASPDGGTKGARRTVQVLRRALAPDLDQQQPPVKHKITNANLKKLLNQSLLKANSTSGGKSTNFKLLFIQRATAAPSNVAGKPAAASSTQTSTQPSLATSVSKQLASTLIHSAVSLIDNLDSLKETEKANSQNELQVSQSGSSAAGDPLDIKRIYTLTQDSKPKGKKGSGGKSRPSKIYNLPVKFVSNGQPNHVVFSAIKQHFATIKKIQAVTKTSGQAKRRKQQQGQKTKGNSRLIYLPLKYLSNARPNRIISGKVTHKHSTSSSSGSSNS